MCWWHYINVSSVLHEAAMSETESSPNNRTASNLVRHTVVSPQFAFAVEFHKKKCSGALFKVVEVLVLSAVVLTLLVVSMIPTAFFVLPPLEFRPVSEDSVMYAYIWECVM